MNSTTDYIPAAGDAPGATPPITFEQYRLANGMEVILREDADAPVVHVLLWYHVGSKNEPPDRTGFAHLFEHMMFQGSENVGKTEHFSYVQGIGGTLNASTSPDITNYYQTVPREYLGLALWLEADRMRSLNVTEENFRNQLSVVKEERKQRYDDQPYGLWYLTMLEMLYAGTSYAWGAIGEMAHLDASPLETVKEFHGRYYRPNNATLIVSGGFVAAEAKKLISEQFGDIASGPDIVRPNVEPAPLLKQSRKTIVSRIPLPALYIGFQGVPVGSPDSAALGLLSLALSPGRSSRLQKSLVYEKQIAQSVFVFDYDQEQTGLIVINAVAAPDQKLEVIEEAIWSELRSVATEGITSEELSAALNAIETQFVRNLALASGVAGILAEYHVMCGDASRVNSVMGELRSVTLDDISRVASKYLAPERAAVLFYQPES